MLADYHFERLFKTLDRLKFQPPSFFTKSYLETQIHELVKKNGQHGLARVRLTIYRGEGGIYDRINHFPHHLIQTWDLNESNNKINENGLVVDIFPDASKIERELGWKPAETFETGMRKTVRWYLDHQAWVRNVTSGAYREWVGKQYGA